jgi:hypothetical protein
VAYEYQLGQSTSSTNLVIKKRRHRGHRGNPIKIKYFLRESESDTKFEAYSEYR